MPTYMVIENNVQESGEIKIVVQKTENCTMRKEFFFRKDDYSERYIQMLQLNQDMLCDFYEAYKGGIHFNVGLSLFTNKYVLTYKG